MSSTTQTLNSENHFVHRGSVRADLLGGTIDIYPVNYILENVVTLNAALDLQAQVEIVESKGKYTRIISKDYQSELQLPFGEDWNKEKIQHPNFKFVIEIIESFNSPKPLVITLSSGAPTGSGLGGSSSMGVTLLKALHLFYQRDFYPKEIVKIVQNLESRQLNKGVPGYQDYFPALYGGILALTPEDSEIKVEQLYTDKLINFLEEHCSLYYSNHSRFSGINNWEVFKAFFDDEGRTRSGLQQIADLSRDALKAIKELNYSRLIDLMIEEGSVRSALFDGIVTSEINEFIHSSGELIQGFKMCGAGGGGCFLVFHSPENEEAIEKHAQSKGMHRLKFKILAPIIGTED